jgi:acyl-coenzyme A synthetase/AMP-(fatty) acid ligase
MTSSVNSFHRHTLGRHMVHITFTYILFRSPTDYYSSTSSGSTEVTGIASMHPLDEKQNPTCGVFVPGVRGKVVKADGSLGKVHEEGELWMQTVAMTTGYLDDEKA